MAGSFKDSWPKICTFFMLFVCVNLNAMINLPVYNLDTYRESKHLDIDINIDKDIATGQNPECLCMKVSCF